MVKNYELDTEPTTFGCLDVGDLFVFYRMEELTDIKHKVSDSKYKYTFDNPDTGSCGVGQSEVVHRVHTVRR